jgi:hypothetical protein
MSRRYFCCPCWTRGIRGALFMTFSGYLFAKLLEGRPIIYTAFPWNRVLRLLPLMLVVIVIAGISKYLSGESIRTYLYKVIGGILLPSLPNGGWSITVEYHYYEPGLDLPSHGRGIGLRHGYRLVRNPLRRRVFPPGWVKLARFPIPFI